MENITKWKPEEVELADLYERIEKSILDEAIFSGFDVTEHIDSLVYIFAHSEDKDLEIRLIAGRLLSKNIKSSDYVKLELMHTAFKTSDVPSEIGTCVVSLINKILDDIGVRAWPELLENILDFSTFGESQMKRALSVLYKICDCEDGMSMLSSSVEVAFAFLDQYNSIKEENEVGEQFASLVVRVVKANPKVLADNVSVYVGLVRDFAASASKEVRTLVTPSFVMLIQLNPIRLQTEVYSMINCVLTLSEDPESSVALSACRFWLSYDSFWSLRGKLEHLELYGQSIFKVLVKNLKYKGAEDSRDEVRLCCIDALKIMFIPSLGDFPFNTLMSILRPMLISKQWEDREAFSFALGEMAGIIVETNDSQLPKILVSIMALSKDRHFLVRSTACRTLSSYARLLVSIGGDQLYEILECLLQRMSDDEIAVRTSACSAIFTFLEILSSDGKDKLSPYIEIILKYANCAFTKDQSGGLTNFCLIIRKLLDDIEENVIENQGFNVLLEQIMSKCQDLLLDRDQLIVCYDIINKVLRGKEPEFLRVVFQNCVSTINAKIQSVEDDKVVLRSLELLNALKLNVRNDLKKLAVNSNLGKLLITCCTHSGSALIRRNAFCLLSSLVKMGPDFLESHLEEIYVAFAAQMKLKRMTSEDKSLASYACSAIAELTRKCKLRHHSESVFSLLLCLISIFKEVEERPLTGPGPELIDSSVVAFSGLIHAYPRHVGSLPHFIRLWCMALSRLSDKDMKLDAFFTLRDIVNSHDALVQSNSVVAMMKYLASLEGVSVKRVQWSIGKMIHNCKKKVGESWNQSLSDEESAKLVAYESTFTEGIKDF